MTLKLATRALPLLFIAFACQQNPTPATEEKEVETQATIDTVQYTINTLSSELPCTKRPSEKCLDISIDLIDIMAGLADDKANKIESDLQAAISKSDNNENAPRTPQQIIDNLKKEYTQIVKDMPGYDLPWQYKSEFQVFLNQNKLFGVQLNSYSFTGGAHGAQFTFYSTYETESGKLLKLGDLFMPDQRANFVALAEKQFTNSHDIDTNMTYEDAGYWFENEEFHLNNNFRYTPQGLEILFNPYEIAPYSEGTITLQFSYSEVKNMLKKEYLF